MAFEVRELSGSLFKNDRQQHDRQPQYTGNCKIDGVEYWISAWIKESQSGKRFFSLSFQPKDAVRQPLSETKSIDFDDDIPF
jgi:hypothetical protein